MSAASCKKWPPAYAGGLLICCFFEALPPWGTGGGFFLFDESYIRSIFGTFYRTYVRFLVLCIAKAPGAFRLSGGLLLFGPSIISQIWLDCNTLVVGEVGKLAGLARQLINRPLTAATGPRPERASEQPRPAASQERADNQAPQGAATARRGGAGGTQAPPVRQQAKTGDSADPPAGRDDRAERGGQPQRPAATRDAARRKANQTGEERAGNATEEQGQRGRGAGPPRPSPPPEQAEGGPPTRHRRLWLSI